MSVFATLRRSVGLSPQKSLTSNASPSGSSPKKAAAATTSSSSSSTTSDKGPVHGYLVLENSDGIETERYPLQKRITTIGRLHQGDIRIYGETVSRLHCQINVDENGKISLQVFNVRGLKLNHQKVQSLAGTSDGDKIFPLQESDLIEIFTHRFRVEYVARDESGRSIIPKNARLGRKSLRMSLVRAAVGQNAALKESQESQAALEEVEDEVVHEDKVEAKTNQAMPAFEQDKENAPIRGRRSYALNTPSRNSTHNGPWETEPRKKKVKRLSMSPVKGHKPVMSSAEPALESDNSIAVMEEVVDSEMDGEAQPIEVHCELAPRVQTNDTPEAPATPSKEPSNPSQRLTQSSSPKKPSQKAKRRSSFFGRAGIFAGLNLGFYPEERRDNEEAKAVEGDLKEVAILSPPTSPSKIQTCATPDPPLDCYGKPRLPRSMSSPSGFNYGSPGKRRVISLRTATLIKTGQQTFEQRKLLSPPPSPTKTISSPSLLSAFTSPSPAKKAAAGQIPLPDSDDDEGDADEVDRSLSSYLEEEEDVAVEEDKPLPPPRFDLSTSRKNSGPRRSHGVLTSQKAVTRVKPKSRGRVSMPGRLLSVAMVEKGDGKAIEEWRKEWEKGAKIGEESQHKSVEMALDDAFGEAQDEITDEEKVPDPEAPLSAYDVELEQKEPSQQESDSTQKEVGRSPMKMLRQMVRGNSDLTALLDKIAGDQATRNDDDVQTDENKDEQEEESRITPTVVDVRPMREVPQELLAGSGTKLSRRASEVSQRKVRRRSSVANKSLPRKSRKSAGAVLHTKEAYNNLDNHSKASNNDANVSEVAVVDELPEEEEEMKLVSDVQEATPEEASNPAEPVDSLSQGEEPEDSPPQEAEPEETLQEEVTKAEVKRSPRKRVVEPSKTHIPVAASRPTRAAKMAITNDLSDMSERTASRSPQKKGSVRGKVFNTSSVEVHSDEVESDDLLHSSRLIMESSSPVKRTKRAAKEQAETKIRNVLVKKPSIAVMRDARSLSEAAGQSTKSSTNPSDLIKARMATTRLPRKAKEVVVAVHSEPTRTTRSRAAAATAARR